ncbi:unnamed protein product, partial [Prorocentrum cordatum]
QTMPHPMHRSLPAETVTRRRKVERKAEKREEPLAADRGVVLKMRPEQRFKWLSKALQKCQEGGFQTTVLYDIATHAKFPSDASEKIAQKMYRALRANLALFSAKQVRYLQSDEFRLAQMFQARQGPSLQIQLPAASPATVQAQPSGLRRSGSRREGGAARAGEGQEGPSRVPWQRTQRRRERRHRRGFVVGAHLPARRRGAGQSRRRTRRGDQGTPGGLPGCAHHWKKRRLP